MSKIRIAVLFVLFVAAAMAEAARLSSLSAVENGDVWWHLSSGLWVLQNHSLPHNGIFSQTAARPWMATSWGFDLLLALAYRLVHLRAIPALLLGMRTGLAVLTFVLAGGSRGKFWSAVALSAIAQFVLGGVQPGPVYFSLLFFGIELLLVFESRRTGNARPLFWLTPLFLLWANLDIQFVYGIALLGLFLVMLALEDRFSILRMQAGERVASSIPNALAASGLAVVATLVTPYIFRPYEIFIASATSAANRYFPDFLAMRFQQPQDYLLLLMTMGAFLALGRRHSRDLFQITLLILAAMLSFYAQRNVWMITLAAVAVIGDVVPRDAAVAPIGDTIWSWRGLATAVTVVVLLVGVILFGLPDRREALLTKVGRAYPVGASDYIRNHALARPLFNSYEWGGFLTWYLPQYPVSIDGRVGLYGDDFIIQYSKVMNADVPYTAFAAMSEARTLLLPKKAIMAEALSTLPGFHVAYSDDVAVVLTRTDDSVAAAR